ncbi:hypothetical protein [Mesorhizobium sp. M0701]|uniref:hypothetical protein n=1 Tax=Mesorhizobium sp. M0701 TaxID=2956989 RepID=UPI0033397ECA
MSLCKAKAGKSPTPGDLIDGIRDVSKEIADRKDLDRPRFIAAENPLVEKDGTIFEWVHYVEKRPPSWFTGDGVTDILNHLVIVAQRGSLYAFLFSDNGLRAAVARKFGSTAKGALSEVERLSATQINKAFVETQVRTLWLSGTQRRTVIKADSKVLAGLELETSLDPLGDQSYYFSSVRSTMPLAEGERPTVVGASPGGARLWIGPTKSWDDFTGLVDAIFARAAKHMDDEGRSGTPLPILASPSVDLKGIERPYDIAFIVPEQASDGNGADVDGESRWLQQFGDAARFEITTAAGSPNFEADVFWADAKLGRLAYEFEPTSESDARLKSRKIDGFDGHEVEKALLKICEGPENLTIYFDTGHTYSRGLFYETRLRDARFEDWEWVRMDRDKTIFKNEKPLVGRRFAVEDIGKAEDKSLFGLVARHWPNMDVRGKPTGWLVCDDGAMESADFIHLDDSVSPPGLTLIHVKGSGSANAKRDLSVSDYEVVVGQAVKNLRHIDRGLLQSKLSANATGVLKDAVWYKGERQKDRKAFLQVLKGLGFNLSKKVVVFQPRVRRSVFNAIRKKMDDGKPTDAAVRRMQQLDALLLGARADCFSLGASFAVVADGDDL